MRVTSHLLTMLLSHLYTKRDDPPGRKGYSWDSYRAEALFRDNRHPTFYQRWLWRVVDSTPMMFFLAWGIDRFQGSNKNNDLGERCMTHPISFSFVGRRLLMVHKSGYHCVECMKINLDS